MNRYIFLLLLISALLSTTAYTQDGSNFSNSAAYVEVSIGGLYGILAEANVSYEHRLFSNVNDNLHIYGRAGLAASGVLFGSGGTGGLLGGTLLTGSKSHHFEADLGVIVGNNEGSGENSIFVHPLAEVGYRFQPPGGGFLFKVKSGATGIFGIALGWAF